MNHRHQPYKPNWNNVPAHLRYVADAADELLFKRGFKTEPYLFLEILSAHDLEELSGVAERFRINGHFPEIDRWLDKYPMDHHDEAALVYLVGARGENTNDGTGGTGCSYKGCYAIH